MFLILLYLTRMRISNKSYLITTSLFWCLNLLGPLISNWENTKTKLYFKLSNVFWMFLFSTSVRYCLSMVSVLVCCTSSDQVCLALALTSLLASLNILAPSVMISSCNSGELPMNRSAPNLKGLELQLFQLMGVTKEWPESAGI